MEPTNLRRVRASSRSVVVVDDKSTRRSQLIDRLTAAGLTALAPKTPLESFELLARNEFDVVLAAPTFADALADSFPQITAYDISDDLDVTVVRALATLTA